MFFRIRIPAWFARAMVLLVVCGCVFARSRAEDVQTTFSNAGLSSLRWQGEELLNDGAVYSYGYFLKNGALVSVGSASNPVFDAAQKRWTQNYAWGQMTISYEPSGSQLKVRASVTNNSPDPIAQFEIGLLKVKFPRLPVGESWANGWENSGLNIDDITAMSADYGSGMLVLCNDVPGVPLKFGFTGLQGGGYVVRMTTNVTNSPTDPVIAPGETRQFVFSLRFAPSGTDPLSLTSDLQNALAANMPQELVWPDRRAIGSIFFASGYHASATNPRGWMSDPSVDVTTPAGLASFKTRMFAAADNCIGILRNMNAQGMIFWDVEGEQYDYINYAGDPTRIADLAPEMDTIADAFFQKFRDAGLRTGVCIRPSKIVPGFPNTGHVWDHNNAGFDVLTNLSDKIAYAQARWGCTLFYIDTNVSWAFDYDGAFKPGLLRASLLRDLRRLHPDVLIIPEIPTTQYWASTAPYREVRGGFTSTPALSRAVYPGAFTIIEPKDTDFEANHAALVNAVRSGDILLFRSWFEDSGNAPIKAIYAEAHPAPVITTTALPNGGVGWLFATPIVADSPLISAANLPPGLALNTASGLISGIPTSAGDYSVTLTAQSLWGATQKTLPLHISSVFEQWIAQHFPGEENTPKVARTADPDGDGLTNFAEFAAGLDPAVHDAAAARPEISSTTDGSTRWLTITFIRRTGAFPGVVYLVKESANLSTWTPVDAAANQVGTTTDLGNGTERVTIRGNRPMSAGGSGFLRVEIQ